MLFPEFFQEDVQLLHESLSQLNQVISLNFAFSEDVKSIAREDDELARTIEGFQEQMINYCNRASMILDKIAGDTPGDTQQDFGLYLAVTVQSMQGSTESLLESLIAAQTPVQPSTPAPSPSGQTTKQSLIQKIANWIRQHVVPILRQVLQGAWRILSNLLTPKGWKVKGSIGTSFLGLANAELEIQFGK